MKTDGEKRYEDALQQLSDLVEQRDQALLQLDTLASLPLSISPRSGNVSEFDLDAAQILLDRLRSQTERIRTAMDAVNRHAEQCSRPEVQWLKMPTSRKRGFATADES